MTAPTSWLLDTNILSEMMGPDPEPRVAGFLDEVAPQGIGLVAVTVWEILDGIGLCTPGKRRDGIADRFQGLLDDLFEDRLFDWTYDSVIVTRNEREFRNTGAKVVNPWARESR